MFKFNNVLEERMNLLSEKDLAKKLSVSVYKLQKDRSRKRGIPYTKIFHAVRYDPIDVAKFLKKNSVRT